MRGLILFVAFNGWLILAMFAWILRDGLGPKSVESHGWQALERFFWCFYQGPLGLLLAAATLLWLRGIRRRSKTEQVVDESSPGQDERDVIA